MPTTKSSRGPMAHKTLGSRLLAVPKGKSQLQDDSIMGTNNSSIVSKRSVERLYHSEEPHFFRHFVKKPQRRSPLINRGYWLRMKAVDQVVYHFLEQISPKKKIVINLGCGYDPLPWQSMVRYPAHCNNVKFIDIDYKDLMIKKRDVVWKVEELSSFLTNVEIPNGSENESVLLRSDQYIQLGCDLRNLELLSQTLASVVDIENSLILLTAEVSITYMDVEAADAVIQWAGNLPNARFCLLEQILPGGPEHPFAKTMMTHFNKLNTPIRAVRKYPTTRAQENRFISLGWSKASARNLWQLWNDSHFINSQDRISLDAMEPFDEWEEFALFGCHYFLLVADTLQVPAYQFSKKTPKLDESCHDIKYCRALEMTYSENPKLQGCRRFGATFPLRSRNENIVGVFGGMGLNTRVSTYDVYATGQTEGITPKDNAMSSVPASRMCHTITDLGEAGALLVGGRTSPDNALADCWLYHKWLDVWERVDDIIYPQYRHGAVSLGSGHVLIAPGKTNSRTISPAFCIWSRKLGWAKCSQGFGVGPLPSYGATFLVHEDSINETCSRRGLLAGGIAEDGRLLDDVWGWELSNMASQEPVISFERITATTSGAHALSSIARFGASAVNHQGQTRIIGGIIKSELLDESNAFFSVDSDLQVSRTVIHRPTSSSPQLLLVGLSLTFSGNTLLVTGGSAVCFSFGTFWNKGCYALNDVGCAEKAGVQQAPNIWKFMHTVAPAKPTGLPAEIMPQASARPMKDVPRVNIGSAADFENVVRLAKPVIISGLDLGPCTNAWSTKYLKENVGSAREVVVHEATTKQLDFQMKNFAYSTKPFGEFIDSVENGGKLYLRSLSVAKPTELPADISKDFPTISNDFRLPPELSTVKNNAHSCPLRISGPVNMWLHYDVMANILCQIRGSKRLLLFPPSDVKYLGFEAGASSSSINVFEDPERIPGNANPNEALLDPGDVLFLPPLWLHAASPAPGMSIAVNVFFRNLQSGYAAGKDVYGNRDLQAYEKGRQDIAKVVKTFDHLPADIRGFYLQRLVKEFEEKAN